MRASEICPDLKIAPSHEVSCSVVALEGEKVIGWIMGGFTAAGTFYMRNSAVVPDHRRKGIYTSMMENLAQFVAPRGVYVLESLHHPSNNEVIIAKLKHGFMIHGMEVDVQFGTLVKLKKYLHKNFDEVFDKRVGYKKWNS